MLRFALRRFYLAIIGLMLLTLPLFAAIRVPAHNNDLCHLNPASRLTLDCGANEPLALARNGRFYATWQTGLPPDDWWPIAVTLLAAEGIATIVVPRRRAETR